MAPVDVRPTEEDDEVSSVARRLRTVGGSTQADFHRRLHDCTVPVCEHQSHWRPFPLNRADSGQFSRLVVYGVVLSHGPGRPQQLRAMHYRRDAHSTGNTAIPGLALPLSWQTADSGVSSGEHPELGAGMLRHCGPDRLLSGRGICGPTSLLRFPSILYAQKNQLHSRFIRVLDRAVESGAWVVRGCTESDGYMLVNAYGTW